MHVSISRYFFIRNQDYFIKSINKIYKIQNSLSSGEKKWILIYIETDAYITLSHSHPKYTNVPSQYFLTTIFCNIIKTQNYQN